VAKLEFDGLYVYVEGWDNAKIASQLTEFLSASQQEIGFEYRIINDQLDPYPDDRPEDLPPWNLGLNVDKVHVSAANLQSLFTVIVNAVSRFERDFAVGYVDLERNITEDITFVEKANDPSELASTVARFLRIED
jgi:hypothetical protein